MRTISSRSFSLARVEISVATSSIASASLNGAGSSTSWPASIFEKSRMSLMMVSSALPDLTMISVKVFCLGSRSDLASSSAMPSTPFIGVRDLVAHIGQEFGLGAVGQHRPALRFLQLLLALLLFGDVDRRAEQIERAVGGDQRALARHLVTHAAVGIASTVSSISWLLPGPQDGAVALHEGRGRFRRNLEVGLADRVLGGNAGQLRPVLVDVERASDPRAWRRSPPARCRSGCGISRSRAGFPEAAPRAPSSR